MSVLELFCHVDDFCRIFEPKWHQQCLISDSKRRNRARDLALSEGVYNRVCREVCPTKGGLALP